MLVEEGRRLARTGRYLDAADCFERGYRECLRAGHASLAARFLVYLANSRLALYQYRPAIEAYSEARRLAHATGDHKLARVLSINIAWLYRAQGALREAEQEVREALDGDRSAPAAEGLLLLADLHVQKNDLDGSLGLFHQALEQAERAGDGATAVRVLDWLGDALLSHGRLEEAEEALLDSYRRRVLGGTTVPALCYRNLATLKLAQGDTQAAQMLSERAFVAARNGAGLAPLWSLYYSRARVRQARGDLEGALADVHKAIDLIQNLRLAYLPADSVRTGAGVGLHTVYELGVEIAARGHRASRSAEAARIAFEMAEINRAIGLRETLGEFDQIRDRLAPEYWETLKRLSDAENLLFRTQSEAAKAQVRRLRLRLTEHEIAAGLAIPATARFRSSPVTAGNVQGALGPSEALFSFHLGRSDTHVWAISRERLEMHCLGSTARLGPRIAEFRRAVAGSSPDEVTALGAALYRLFFGGASEEILRKPDWLLLVDGVLFELPFAALVESGPNEEPVYLVERHSLRLLPGAAMLLAGGGETWRGPMLALGDAIYNRADVRWQSPEPERVLGRLWRPRMARGVEMARLAGSAREIERAAASYRAGGAPPILLAGPQASVRAFQEALEWEPSVLHLATHVIPSADNPAVGQIAMSLGPEGAPELLGMDDISALRARPQLVVMTGCSSGAGELLAGEGLWGLTRAWLRAGARCVTVTFWPVADHSGELLQAFYRQLGGAGPGGFAVRPERALQLAQKEMIRSGNWRSRPAHWAAFFVVSRN
jgi:CHAT domain-containing protein/Tfp pilus assembly protein PilF